MREILIGHVVLFVLRIFFVYRPVCTNKAEDN